MATPSPIVHLGPTWAQVLVPAVLGFVALLLAAGIGAWLQARWARKQAFELHRVAREQDALLRFLDLLAKIDTAMRRSLPGPRDPTLSWSEAIPGLGSSMLRETPGFTWDRSEGPDQELHQWALVVNPILDAEEEWRDHLSARVNRPDLAAHWWEIASTGGRMGLRGAMATHEHLEALHAKLQGLMDDIRRLT